MKHRRGGAPKEMSKKMSQSGGITMSKNERSQSGGLQNMSKNEMFQPGGVTTSKNDMLQRRGAKENVKRKCHRVGASHFQKRDRCRGGVVEYLFLAIINFVCWKIKFCEHFYNRKTRGM